MSTMSSISSLLNFLDAPIVVGDPEGGAIFINPAFERAFSTTAEVACSQPLAELFEGGGREAILGAVAAVCSGGETVKFRLKEAGGAYLGLASPIVAEDDRVGVVILLTEEPPADERLVAIQSEMREPIEKAEQAFEEILEQTGGRRSERYRELVERGLSALERAKKWNAELHGVLVGRVTSQKKGGDDAIDPVKVTRDVASQLGDEFDAANVGLQLLVPPELQTASGDPNHLEAALTRLLRDRLESAKAGALVTLSARSALGGEPKGVLLSIVDAPASPGNRSNDDADALHEPREVVEAVVELGGRLCTVEDADLGRVTSICLEPQPAA
jgi:hypothetical protein